MNVNPDYNQWASLIKEFEGCKLTAYTDTGGIVTIGFGTTYLYDKKRKVLPGDVISYADAVSYLRYDSTETARLANLYVKKPLTSYQSVAICDYIYNRGIGNFLKASYNGWGLDELISFNPTDARILTVIEQTGLRDKLGNLLNGLIRRRKCQAFLYKTGVLKFQF